MRTKHRRFQESVPQHLYIRGARRQTIFFEELDRLVYLMAFSTTARKTGIIILALAVMFDHLHSIGIFQNREQMADFERNHLSYFALAYNQDAGRKGSLFEKAYGNAPKWTPKKIKSAIIYVGNNQVEKQLCEKAEEHRWNLIAYLKSDHPYSPPIERKKASAQLRRCLKTVDSFVGQNTVIPYRVLRRLFGGLTALESEQLTDYIVSHYNPIDKKAVLSFFDGSYEQYLLALHSTTGNDFDIKEDLKIPSDIPYVQLITICKHSIFKDNLKTIQGAPQERKKEIADYLLTHTDASPYEIGKFLDMGGG